MKNASRRFPRLSRLRELLIYDPATGIITWRVTRPGQMRPGMEAGTIDGKGYLRIRIDGVDYRGHRLAWFMHYEAHPIEEIDHKNRDKLDNRIVNLRHADRSINVLNRGRQKNNSTGTTGVNWRKDRRCWTASISVNKKSQHLGYFYNIEEAKAARRAAEIRIRGEDAQDERGS